MYNRKIGASQVKTRQFGAIRVNGVASGLDISKQGLLPMNEKQRHIGSFFEFQLKIIKIHGNTKAGRNIYFFLASYESANFATFYVKVS